MLSLGFMRVLVYNWTFEVLRIWCMEQHLGSALLMGELQEKEWDDRGVWFGEELEVYRPVGCPW